MAKKFHLGWFMNFIPPEWDTPWASPDVARWPNGRFYVDMAKNLERACFDYIMIEDTVMVADAYGGTMEGSLKNSVFAPKHDPMPLAVLIAANTSRLGVVATMSTSFYPPYLLARLASTVDSIAEGRFGWNIVSSAEDRAAQNFGLDALPEHDERYNVADEYYDLVKRALGFMGRRCGRHGPRDPHLRRLQEGAHHRLRRQVLQVTGTAQHRALARSTSRRSCRQVPLPRGRAFAARAADAIVAVGTGIEGMQAYRDDIRARAKAAGRNPDDIKLMFCVSPTVAATEAEARAEVDRLTAMDSYIEKSLAGISSNTEIDFKQFDWDEPLPEGLTTNGERARSSTSCAVTAAGAKDPAPARNRLGHHRRRIHRHAGTGRPQDGRGDGGDRR